MRRFASALILGSLLVGLVAAPAAARAPTAPRAPTLVTTRLVPSEFINGAIGDPFGRVWWLATRGPQNLVTLFEVHGLQEVNSTLDVTLLVDTFGPTDAISLGTVHIDGAGRAMFFARTALPPGAHTLILSIALPGCDGDSSCIVLVTPAHFGVDPVTLNLP